MAAPVSVQENQLEFRFHHVHDFPVTLTASVEEQKLKPQTFVTKGEHVYRAEVPARVFAKPGVTVTFELDRAFTTTDGDVRQMGVVVSFFRSGSVTSDQNLPLTFV